MVWISRGKSRNNKAETLFTPTTNLMRGNKVLGRSVGLYVYKPMCVALTVLIVLDTVKKFQLANNTISVPMWDETIS